MSSHPASSSSEFQSAMLNVNMSCEFSAAFVLLTFPHQWKSHTITITLVVHFKQERRECRQETMCNLPLIIFSALSLRGQRQTQSYLWHETFRHWIQCQTKITIVFLIHFCLKNLITFSYNSHTDTRFPSGGFATPPKLIKMMKIQSSTQIQHCWPISKAV